MTTTPNNSGKRAFLIPLTFASGILEKEVTVQILGKSYTLYFNLNTVELTPDYRSKGTSTETASQLYLSCYDINKSNIYFGSYRCVFGAYINEVDNGFPYKFFFLNNSGKTLSVVDFDNINAGVNLFAIER